MSRALTLLGTRRRKSDSRKCRCSSAPHCILIAGAVLHGKRLDHSLQKITSFLGFKRVSKDNPRFFHHPTAVFWDFSARAAGSSIAGLIIVLSTSVITDSHCAVFIKTATPTRSCSPLHSAAPLYLHVRITGNSTRSSYCPPPTIPSAFLPPLLCPERPTYT